MTIAAPALSAARTRPVARIIVLALYAAAMGWVEAVVVIYLRGLLGFTHASLPPAPDRLVTILGRQAWIVPTEQAREAATIVMLATVAWLAGRSLRSRCGAFLIAFGVWDIFYYVALFMLVHWPPSLGTMDLLFLIPPSPLWNQPVWVPIAISCGMVALGTWLMGERNPVAGADRGPGALQPSGSCSGPMKPARRGSA